MNIWFAHHNTYKFQQDCPRRCWFFLCNLCLPVCFFILYPLKYPSSLKMLNLWLFDIELFQVSYPYFCFKVFIWLSPELAKFLGFKIKVFFIIPCTCHCCTYPLQMKYPTYEPKSRKEQKISHLKSIPKHQHIKRHK